MSKAILKFFETWLPQADVMKRIMEKTFTPGSRIYPTDKRDDAKTELRIDAGERVGDEQNIILQVNSQAKSKSLKEWLSKNGRGTHGKLATAKVNTKAADKDAEVKRVIADMKAEARGKVG